MDQTKFRGYLALLRELSGALADLTEVEQEKTRAVRGDDLNGLNACMKREQVLTMTLRGYDQKREAFLSALDLTGVPLGGLPARAPEECRDETRRTVEELRREYALFHGAFEVARDTLECNLHQIEKILNQMDAGGEGGPGYGNGESQLPPSLRTDFRA